MRCAFFSAVMLAGVSGFLPAQEPLQPVFRIDVDSTLPWFAADGSTRGMALIPNGDLLVSDRGPDIAVYRLDPATGRETGRLDMMGVAEGTFPVNKIATSADGKIYLANLASDGKPFRIYYYDSVDAAPFLMYEEAAPSARWGDGFAVTGQGGSTRLLVTGGGNPAVQIIDDPDGDGVFTARIITPSSPPLVGHNEAAWDVSRTRFWLRQATAASVTAYQYDMQGNRTGSTNAAGSMYGALAVASAREGTEYVMGITPVFTRGGETRLPGLVFGSQTIGIAYATSVGLEKTGGAAENINGSGEVVFDSANSRVYFLMTNNSISGWALPVGVLD